MDTLLLRALATPRRREILRLLCQAPRTSGEIHRSFSDVTFGAISQHLGVLARAGVVTVRARGRERVYSARRAGLGPFRRWLEESWNDALYRLKLLAELEEARRGPRPVRPRGSRSRPGPARRRDP